MKLDFYSVDETGRSVLGHFVRDVRDEHNVLIFVHNRAGVEGLLVL